MTPPIARLRKELKLLDIYVISTSAMVSSGFFLLPGLAAVHTGSGVVLAYLAAGILIIPAMLSIAELATAMPRAGGTYYFLDRTLGPIVGTIGGLGTWLALVRKTAFALIGMGAYLALVVDIPLTQTAIAFTIAFGALNVVGAKESSGILRVLVTTLLSILFLFIVAGLADVISGGSGVLPRERFSTPFPNGVDGFLETIGLVFVAFIGLTNVASLAEEVRNPERSIPLGMGLALLTVTAIYVIGVYLMVAVLGPDTLAASLTPVADTAAAFQHSLPPNLARWLMVLAATVAFASMANAGILAASRYPLAMARDRLVSERFATLGRFGTPVMSIALTCGLVIILLVVLNVEQVAKLASALQLLLFGLINVSVIVMRESRIESYDPGFKSPGYPWVQLAGIFVALVLVAEMGWLPVLSTLGVTALCFAWYTYYARDRIVRDGAIYHVFERLGRRRFAGLDRELRDIMKEKGARAEDPFDEVVAQAIALDVPSDTTVDSLLNDAADRLSQRLPTTVDQLLQAFHRSGEAGGTPITHQTALIHTRLADLEHSVLAIARSKSGIVIEGIPVNAVFILVSGEHDPGRHLRILAQLAGRVEAEDFLEQWMASTDEQELKEVLLRDDRFLSLSVASGTMTEPLIDKALRDLDIPDGSLVALIQRGTRSIVPRGATVLREGDRLTLIGEPTGLQHLAHQFGKSWP